MPFSRTVAAAILTLAVLAPQLRAQTHPLVGSWNVVYQSGLSNEDGVITAIMGKGQLQVTQSGDSLVGLLMPEASGNAPARPALRLAGLASRSSPVLNGTSNARVIVNGDQRTVTTTISWELTATGDALSGLMTRSSLGVDMPNESTQITGQRVK
jgi:hypothetical protein